MTDWKEHCSRCTHLIRSGDDGSVWHCGAVRSGWRPVYAVTARTEPSRKTHPTMGKCGRAARLFIAAPDTPAAERASQHEESQHG